MDLRNKVIKLQSYVQMWRAIKVYRYQLAERKVTSRNGEVPSSQSRGGPKVMSVPQTNREVLCRVGEVMKILTVPQAKEKVKASQSDTTMHSGLTGRVTKIPDKTSRPTWSRGARVRGDGSPQCNST